MQAGALACEAYSVKSIRDYIKGFPKGDAFMDAMKYMFEVFEGRERLDSINVKKNLSIISYYIKEKSGELKRIFKKIGSDNRLILSFNENSEVSVAEKIKDLTGPEICLLLKVGKGDLHIDPVSRFFRPGDIILKVNNFDKITNTKDEKYELNMVFNCIKGTVFVAVKNESGKWILFLNNKIEEVSQEYVMKLASCTDGEMHLGYVRK